MKKVPEDLLVTKVQLCLKNGILYVKQYTQIFFLSYHFNVFLQGSLNLNDLYIDMIYDMTLRCHFIHILIDRLLKRKDRLY